MRKLSFLRGAHFGNIAGALFSAFLCAGSLGAADVPPGVEVVDLTSPSGTAFSVMYPNSGAWNDNKSYSFAFDDGTAHDRTDRVIIRHTEADVGYDFGVAKNVNAYSIQLPYDDGISVPERAPKEWLFQGSNDKENWETLDDRTGDRAETGWSVHESRFFKFSNGANYRYYRIYFKSINSTQEYLQFAELEFYSILDSDNWSPQTAGYAKKVEFTAAGVPENVTLAYFPLLVRLSSSTIDGFLLTDIQRADHGDIIFVDADGKYLPHEIDTWDAESGEALVWVRITSLTKNATFRMYYGADESSGNDPTRVWTSYAGVWHFTVGATPDSSVNAFEMTFEGNAKASSDGRIGAGVSNGVAKAKLPFGALKDGSKFAASGWFKPTKNSETARLISSKKDYTKEGFDLMYVKDTGLYLRGNANNNTVMYKPSPATAAMPTGAWIHYAGVADGTPGAIYMNGTSLASGTIAAVTGHEGGKLALGGDCGGGNLFTGYCDELRVYNGVPSDAWIQAEAQSLADGYVEYGDAAVNDSLLSGSLMVTGAPAAYGVSNPEYGLTQGLSQGEEVPLSVSESVFINGEETLKAICLGWKVYTNNVVTHQWECDENDPSSHGTGNSFTYTHGSTAGKVEWQFKLQAYINVSPFGDGTVTGSGWYDVGSQVTITATANGTNVFRRWEDMPEGVDGSTAEVTFTVTGPVAPKPSIGGVRYVAKTGNDETNTGLSAESPFLTINHALIDLGAPGGTVNIAAGTYVETNGVDLAAINITNEVSLIGATGHAEDVIVKRKSTDYTRHVIHLDNKYAVLRHLTIAEGSNWADNWGNSDYGMNVRIGTGGGAVEDCILTGINTGNYDQKGQCLWMAAGRVSRCRFLNNKNTSSWDNILGAVLYASGGIVEDCLFASNSCYNASTVYLSGGASIVNCTITANSGAKYSGVFANSDKATVANCVIFGNTASETLTGHVYRGHGERFFNCYSDLAIQNSVNSTVGSNPFAAPGDYHIVPGPCMDGGTDRASVGAIGQTDLDGVARVAGTAVDIGCYEIKDDELTCGFAWSVASPIVRASVTLTGTASADDATFAWRIVNETTGAETTVPASASNSYVFETGEAGLYSVTLTVSAGGDSASHTESAIFRLSPKDVYVDASSTSPEFPYDTWAKAATAVATGVEAAADGATVHVADGLYEIGAQILVDKGIRLVGESGRPAGVVVKRTANNARNINVNNSGAFVANMTFEDGLVSGHGGCLYLGVKGGTVSNCVFRGGRTTANNDYSGGGVLMMAGLLTHCEITDCTSVHKDGGSQTRTLKMNGGRVSNCFIHDNVADYNGSLVALVDNSSAKIENCTIVNNVVKAGQSAVWAGSGTTVRNCAIFSREGEEGGEYAKCGGSDAWNDFWPRRFENCATKGMIAIYKTDNGGNGWYYGINCVTNVTEADCFVNYAGGKFRPKNDGPLWNAGTNGVGVLPSVDFAGKPRIYKEIIDIGCLEGIDEGLSIIVR